MQKIIKTSYEIYWSFNPTHKYYNNLKLKNGKITSLDLTELFKYKNMENKLLSSYYSNKPITRVAFLNYEKYIKDNPNSLKFEKYENLIQYFSINHFNQIYPIFHKNISDFIEINMISEISKSDYINPYKYQKLRIYFNNQTSQFKFISNNESEAEYKLFVSEENKFDLYKIYTYKIKNQKTNELVFETKSIYFNKLFEIGEPLDVKEGLFLIPRNTESLNNTDDIIHFIKEKK